MESVKISSLELENVKRIRAVQIVPTSAGLTVIGGNNGQGKTSVLDAIAWALGGDRYRPSAPTRDGSVIPPRIRLELSNGLVVERSGKNSALKVADPTGQRAGQQLPICQRDELHPCGADRFDSRPSAAGQKAQLWDAIFPAILQCASGDSGLRINQLYEVYMRGTKYTDDLVCSMSKLLIRAAESNVYSHDTALVRELIKILVAEVFENRENREEEE